jgi:glycosyltransferase involved in cell wall biosynthesis
MTDASVERPPSVLVTLPVFNEAAFLRASVESVMNTLTEAEINFTLSIAEDGSFDGSKECIREIQARHPTILVQSAPERRGRGWALRTLWSKVEADFYAFSDTDFAADPRFLVEAIRIAQKGNPVVTGSRYQSGARVNRPPARRWVSQGYNRLIRLLFRDHVLDHQCGLKVFSRRAVRMLLPLTREDSWFWDTEILVYANDSGLAITEFPVEWVERKVKRTKMIRLGSDVFLHGRGIIRLKSNRESVGGQPRLSAATSRLGAFIDGHHVTEELHS